MSLPDKRSRSTNPILNSDTVAPFEVFNVEDGHELQPFVAHRRPNPNPYVVDEDAENAALSERALLESDLIAQRIVQSEIEGQNMVVEESYAAAVGSVVGDQIRKQTDFKLNNSYDNCAFTNKDCVIKAVKVPYACDALTNNNINNNNNSTTKGYQFGGGYSIPEYTSADYSEKQYEYKSMYD